MHVRTSVDLRFNADFPGTGVAPRRLNNSASRTHIAKKEWGASHSCVTIIHGRSRWKSLGDDPYCTVVSHASSAMLRSRAV